MHIRTFAKKKKAIKIHCLQACVAFTLISILKLICWRRKTLKWWYFNFPKARECANVHPMTDGRKKCLRSVQLYHGDIIPNRSNNSVILLQKSIEIGKPLISSVPREFERRLKRLVTRLLPQNVRHNILKNLLGCKL